MVAPEHMYASDRRAEYVASMEATIDEQAVTIALLLEEVAEGCHSVDGTFLTFGPDVNLPRLMSWLDDAEAAPMLTEAAS